jgi:hypothetical protein
MEEQHTTHKAVLHSGADYLDRVVADMERQAETMEAQAQQTQIPRVREGYEKFAEVLRHCVQTLKDKSRELRSV